MKRHCDVATNISLTCFKELPWPILLTCQGLVLRRSTIQLDGLLSEHNLEDKMSLGQKLSTIFTKQPLRWEQKLDESAAFHSFNDKP